jgi:four helix bundle protein
MGYNFEKLNVWQESRIFIKEIYQICQTFPKSELFALCDQIKRAAVSVALNIAEGADKKSNKDFVRFLRISLGSINETVTCLFIARDLNYIDETKFNNLYEFAHKLSAMLNALIRKLDEK